MWRNGIHALPAIYTVYAVLTLHGEGFTRASLTICEDCTIEALKNIVNKVSECFFI